MGVIKHFWQQDYWWYFLFSKNEAELIWPVFIHHLKECVQEICACMSVSALVFPLVYPISPNNKGSIGEHKYRQAGPSVISAGACH